MGANRTSRNKTVKDFFAKNTNIFIEEEKVREIQNLRIIRERMEEIKFLQMFVDTQLYYYQKRHGELLRQQYKAEKEAESHADE